MSTQSTAFKMTFYQRPLPDSCIAFTSPQGRSLMASALQTGGLRSFYHLIQQHSTQAEPAYCGISTLTICLNAFALDPRQSWKNTPWRWYDETLLNCCVPLETIQSTGISLPTFACLAKCQGVQVKTQYAQDVTEEDFRQAVKQACVEVEQDDREDDNDDIDSSCNHLEHILVVSYDRRVLQQTGSGHFSPIAAYDAASDSVLVLDTARFKYGVHWVKLPLLFQAMLPKDPETDKSRGFVTLTNKRELREEASPSHLPMSVLLQSTMAQAAVRRDYKQYLTSRTFESKASSITWEDVLQYWTSDDDVGDSKGASSSSDASRLWKLVKPRPRPTPDETEREAFITRVRSLIQALLPENTPLLKSTKCCSCGPHDLRSLDLREDEVLFLVYLASIDERECETIVLSHPKANEAAQEQLLAEATLLRIAIETSDVIDTPSA